MALKGNTTEEKIWNFLKGKGLNDYGIAGLMGNLFAESGLSPINLENSKEGRLGYSDSSYTIAVDRGTYKNFISDNSGYGLAQWTYSSRKNNLLQYAKSNNKSIGDLEMQLNFLYEELSTSFTGVLSTLRNATSIKQASDSVLFDFENPANKSSSVQDKRASYGKGYYDKFTGTGGGGSDDSSTEDKYDYSSTSPIDAITGLSGNLPLSKTTYYYDEFISALDVLEKSKNSYSSIIDLTKGGEFKFLLPESYTETLPVSWDTSPILGRSVPPVGYNNSGPRSIQLEITLMAGAGYYDLPGKTHDQVMEIMYNDINFVRSLVYPDYDYTIVQPPSTVLLSCGSQIKLKGVVSGCSVTYQKPFDSQNRAMRVLLSVTISQVADEPPSYSDIRNNTNNSY